MIHKNGAFQQMFGPSYFVKALVRKYFFCTLIELYVQKKQVDLKHRRSFIAPPNKYSFLQQSFAPRIKPFIWIFDHIFFVNYLMCKKKKNIKLDMCTFKKDIQDQTWMHGRLLVDNLEQFLITFSDIHNLIVGHYVLKVSKFRNVFLVSSILPKNERKQFDLRYQSSKVDFWRIEKTINRF